MPTPKEMTTKEAAAYLGIGRDALEALAGKGLVVRYRLGGRWRYDKASLDSYRRKQREEGEAVARELRQRGERARPVRPRYDNVATIRKIGEIFR